VATGRREVVRQCGRLARRWPSLAAVAVVMLAGILAGCATGSRPATSPTPAAGSGRVLLLVENGAESLRVTAASLGPPWYRAQVTPAGAATFVVSAAGAVEVRQGRPGRGATHIAIELSRRMTWQIVVRGGTTTCNLELAGLHLSGLSVSGGAETMRLDLPAPQGRVEVVVTGGATNLIVTAPGGAAMRVVAASGVGHIRASGSGMVLADNSHLITYWGYATAADSYTVELKAGAASLELSEP